MKKISEYLLIFAIIILGVFLFWPSFKLALFGDDWISIWNYKSIVAADKTSLFKYFFTLYGPQDILMGTISRIFGNNGTIYYELSFIFRALAALSLYPLVNYLTKNKLAAFFVALLFMTTFIGLEATNWVFNMNVYLSIALMNSSIFFLLVSRKDQNNFKLFISIALFYLAHIIAPTRVTLFLVIIFVLEIMWGITNQKIIRSLARVLPFLLIFTISKIFGGYASAHYTTVIFDNFTSGVYNLQFLKRLFITTGSLIIPEIFLPNRWLAIIGILLYLAFIFLLLKFRKKRDLFILSFFLVVTGITTPMLVSPGFNYVSSHRHLLLAAPGVAIFLGSLVGLSKKGIIKGIIITFVVFLLTLQVISINKYFENLVISRSQALETKVWDQLRATIPNPKTNPDPLVFYFEADPESSSIVSDLVYFGFPSKIGVLYNIFSPFDLPSAADRFEILPQILKEGRTVDGKNYQKVPLENFYAYRLEDQIKLINITSSTRERLTKTFQK